jgi:hypothetical protein
MEEAQTIERRPRMTFGSRNSKTALLAGIVMGAMVAIFLLARHETVPVPRRPVTAVPSAGGQAGPIVVAKVGPRTLTNVDLARFRGVRDAIVGVSGEGQALQELCERTLLDLLAADDGLDVSDAEVRGEVMRRQFIIRATSGSLGSPGLAGVAARRGRAGGPSSPPATPGVDLPSGNRPEIDPRALAEEAREDLLAAKAKEAEVYSKITVTPAEVQSALRAEMLAAGAAADAGPRLDKTRMASVEARLRREKGEPEVQALLERLHARWRIDVVR